MTGSSVQRMSSSPPFLTPPPPALCAAQGEAEGLLMIKRPWPSMMRTLAGDHDRFEATYFSMIKGMYFTGDGARRDKDGYFWIIGRVDDVINVRRRYYYRPP